MRLKGWMRHRNSPQAPSHHSPCQLWSPRPWCYRGTCGMPSPSPAWLGFSVPSPPAGQCSRLSTGPAPSLLLSHRGDMPSVMYGIWMSASFVISERILFANLKKDVLVSFGCIMKWLRYKRWCILLNITFFLINNDIIPKDKHFQ